MPPETLPSQNMLRVVFFGMDLSILDALRQCPVRLLGAYLPDSAYRLYLSPPWWLKRIPALFIQKNLRKNRVYAGLAKFLSEHRIKPLIARNVNQRTFRRLLLNIAPDLGVVANFGQILKKPLLSIPRYGFINYHPSLLPAYRGPTPLPHILLNKESLSGVTWHQMTVKPDQGPILAQKTFSIDPADSLKNLEKKCVHAAVALLGPLIETITAGNTRPIPQNEMHATYFPKVTKQEKQRLASIESLQR